VMQFRLELAYWGNDQQAQRRVKISR